MKLVSIATAAVLALTAASAQAATQMPAGEASAQASIPFAHLRSTIREWKADKEEGIWVQDIRRQWYYAKLMGPCHGLDFAVTVGFRTRGTTSLDRFGEIIVPGRDRCPIQSLTRSEAPPGRETVTDAAVGTN